MIDVPTYQGISQFGRAYQAMLENDLHAPGSVDRELMARMIRLCPETADWLYGGYTPTLVGYEVSSRPELERHAAKATAGCGTAEEKIAAVNKLCMDVSERATEDLEETRCGGTEEEIIARGSWNCTEIARVGCILCQIAGLPARMVYLFDTRQAYSGHAIIEVYRRGIWGAVCPETDVIYRHSNGRPASTWELQNQPDLIEAQWRGPATLYTTAGQFRGAAISNYFVGERQRYNYTVSFVNDYYRSILDMSRDGWPGGLRWLHGEDSI
jgi:hypothetical protein